MSTYLVVLDKGIQPSSLRYGLLDLMSQRKPLQFVLLHSPQRLPGETEEEARTAARDIVSGARSLLSTMGLPVVDAIVGDPLPRKAIALEMKGGRRTYDGIVLTSKPSGLLRLLHFDIASQLQRKYQVPVTYVEPDNTMSSVAA